MSASDLGVLRQENKTREGVIHSVNSGLEQAEGVWEWVIPLFSFEHNNSEINLSSLTTGNFDVYDRVSQTTPVNRQSVKNIKTSARPVWG